MNEYIATEVRAGRWEQVWKKVGKNTVPAYRAVRKIPKPKPA